MGDEGGSAYSRRKLDCCEGSRSCVVKAGGNGVAGKEFWDSKDPDD